MLTSAPTLNPQYTFPVNDLDSYLRQVERTLKSFDPNLCDRDSSAVASLKQTLTQIEVAQIKQTAISQGIWDFYPTTKPVIDKMLAIAQIQPHHHVLEPSAGTGDLATAISLWQRSAIAKTGIGKVDCFEVDSLLQKALELQGFNLVGGDFFSSTPQPVYDRVIANPPFSNNGVAKHTTHAFKFLKPGGRLITLAHHYRLKPSKSDLQFFAWLKRHHAKFLNLGNAFKHGKRKTNVNLQLILIDKP